MTTVQNLLIGGNGQVCAEKEDLKDEFMLWAIQQLLCSCKLPSWPLLLLLQDAKDDANSR